MTFQNYVCWDTSRVRQVMNTSAEHAARHIFLAVHSEYPLIVSSSRTGTIESNRDWTIQPQEFLQAFLSKDSPHMQVAVLGNSGSGKSHFISWMKYSLPQSADRYTITVPRTGVSLRGVLDQIINVLPEEVKQPYLAELNQSGSQHSSPDQLEERLLSEIAFAIQADNVQGSGDPDLEYALITDLPHVFHDPFLREHFRRPGSAVPLLATQVLSASNEYLPAEERREFSLEDLPLSGVQTADMSSSARNTCDFLRSNLESQGTAVEVINRNLDTAIRRVLNFTGDRLIGLLADVRRNLSAQGKELVLLIEDLARLQGLDLSLLEALIEEGTQENGLCTLRWAAAVTTGYYTRLPNTVHTRMNYVLSMDLPTDGEEGSIEADDIVAFAAKYLNASRTTDQYLVDWADFPEGQRGSPPIACVSCAQQPVCHSAFGARDGIGLYPFNKDALINMLRRQDPGFDQKFNPRVLVKEILAEVLGTYGEDLGMGRFPSQLLLNQMQGAKLPPLVRDQLRQQNSEQADRQLTILELWGRGLTQPEDLASELYTAFGTVKPELQGTAPQPEYENNDGHAARQSQTADPTVQAIQAWGNGASMQDKVANILRPLVFDSIMSHIDWDMAGLVQGYFTGTTSGFFRRDSVSFAGQLTQAATRPVRLSIPPIGGQQELDDAAIALEGLYNFTRHGHWDFPGGRDQFAVYANCLERWSFEVLQKVTYFKNLQERWDAAYAAMEILTVGATMAGQGPRRGSDDFDWLNAVFGDWPEELPSRSREWQSLYKDISQERVQLVDFVHATTSGSKGGRQGQFIDPTALLSAIKRVRSRWQLSSTPPETILNQQNILGRIARLNHKVRSELAAVAEVEWHQSTDWAKDWWENFGDDITAQEVIGEIRGLLELAVDNGVYFTEGDRQAVGTVLFELEETRLDDSLRSAAQLLERNDPIRLLPMLARGRANAAGNTARRLIPALNRLLDRLENSVVNLESNSGTLVSELQANQTTIETSLEQLVSGLKVMEGNHVKPD